MLACADGWSLSIALVQSDTPRRSNRVAWWRSAHCYPVIFANPCLPGGVLAAVSANAQPLVLPTILRLSTREEPLLLCLGSPEGAKDPCRSKILSLISLSKVSLPPSDIMTLEHLVIHRSSYKKISFEWIFLQLCSFEIGISILQLLTVQYRYIAIT